jgi:hypothetical protein
MLQLKNSRNHSKKFTDWERFQSLASNLKSSKFEINSGIEADKATRHFTSSIASAYRLSTSKITLSKLNNHLPGLDQVLKYKKLKTLRQETRDPECKTAVNRISKSITCMTQKKALEKWETKLANTEATPQAKSLTRKGKHTDCY